MTLPRAILLAAALIAIAIVWSALAQPYQLQSIANQPGAWIINTTNGTIKFCLARQGDILCTEKITTVARAPEAAAE